MGYRRFADRSGNVWEVRDRSRWEWEFIEVSKDSGERRAVEAPGHESDPFELSDEELQKLVDDAGPARRTSKPVNPFGD